MTPHEATVVIEAHSKRVYLWRRLAAWVVAYLIQVPKKDRHKFTVDRLLGESDKRLTAQNFGSAAEMLAYHKANKKDPLA